MIQTQYINLNMIPSGVMPVLYCSQYDVGRPLGMVVYNGGEAVDLDTYTCTIEATRTDGTAITAAVTTDDNIGVFTTSATMTNQADRYPVKLVLFDSNNRRVASLAFIMCVTPKTMDENAESIQEDESLYQQYTGTVQALIAEIREDISDLNDKVDRRTTYCYKDFGAVGDGITNDYDAIKACHLAANAANVPIVNYGGTYYATGAAIPVATDVYNYGTTFIVGNSNLGEHPLFLMSHDSESSVSNVLLSSVFSDQSTVNSSYADKAFVITTSVALGTSLYTGQTGEVIEEPVLALGTKAALSMDDYATVSGWTVDVNHVTDAKEHGYVWHGGIVRQKDETGHGICFIEVARNNCTVESLLLDVSNATAENTIIYGYTANNLTISDIKAFNDTQGNTWGNYSVSVLYSANLLVRNLKSSSPLGGSSTVTTRCMKNFTMRDSVSRTFDVHWNAFGVFLVDGCVLTDSAHVGYGNGIMIVRASTVVGNISTRRDFVPIFRGSIVFEDSRVGFVSVVMPTSDDTTRDMTYFATLTPPKYFLKRVEHTRTDFMFWSGINETMAALLTDRIEVELDNMPIGRLSTAYETDIFRLTARNATDFNGLGTWQSHGTTETDSAYMFNHTAPTFVSEITSSDPNIHFYEHGGTSHLSVSALITGNVSSWSPVMTIANLKYTPKYSVNAVGKLGSSVIALQVNPSGDIITLDPISVSAATRFVFNISW